MTRTEFEDFISSSPIEKSVERWPIDLSPSVPWPGQYKEYVVEVAWQVLVEAKRLKKLREAT